MKSWQFIQSQMSENGAKDLWLINTSQLSCFYVLGLLFINYQNLPMLSKDICLFLWHMECHRCYIAIDVITCTMYLWSIYLCSCICLTGENLPDHFTSLRIVWFLLSENIFSSTSVFEWTFIVHELLRSISLNT